MEDILKGLKIFLIIIKKIIFIAQPILRPILR